VEHDVEAAVARWVLLFNQGEYFEAHEVLEHPWLRAGEPERTFLKGLIHAAVALHHYRRGNGHGARVKYGSCVRYLSAYHAGFRGVQVEDLVRQMDRFFADLIAQPAGAAPPPAGSPWPVVRRDAKEISPGSINT
jgi:uncharacterized protein